MVIVNTPGGLLDAKCIDCFERLYRESADRRNHGDDPHIGGQPFRIKYLEQVYQRIAKFRAWCTGTASRSSSGTRR
jgi:hypothetical protein